MSFLMHFSYDLTATIATNSLDSAMVAGSPPRMGKGVRRAASKEKEATQEAAGVGGVPPHSSDLAPLGELATGG